ncbi:MAG: GIY-YIG nuclease family protein [Helicobacter sp.]|nr:GIY-YIG nuclease family protein [Helicobacter sp.]
MKKHYYVYILFNHKQGTLYVGVTNQLLARVLEHKNGIGSSFTKQYAIDKLGYYEVTDDIEIAIAREKQLKSGNRAKKIALIESLNPNWEDLFDSLCAAGVF